MPPIPGEGSKKQRNGMQKQRAIAEDRGCRAVWAARQRTGIPSIVAEAGVPPGDANDEEECPVFMQAKRRKG